MKHALFSVVLALVGLSAQAQFAPVTTAPVSLSPISAMPEGKLYVAPQTIPGPRAGQSTERYGVNCIGTYAECVIGERAPDDDPGIVVDGVGQIYSGDFREGCSVSHHAFDDPIVHPGRSGITHLHTFSGNTKTRSATDLINMATSGDSTCKGGTLNRTGYWWPTLIIECHDDINGNPTICPTGRIHGQVLRSDGGNFYYKCDYGFSCKTGGFGGTPIEWWPPGFRQIAGDANSTTMPGAEIKFTFYNSGVGGLAGNAGEEVWQGRQIPQISQLKPDRGGPTTFINAAIAFPICIDKTQLDSPDHKSHTNMLDTAYLANFYTGCANNPNHPTLVPEIGLNVGFIILETDLPHLRFSSDPSYKSGRPAGWTFHADWVNGWSTAPKAEWGGRNVTQTIIRGCYVADSPTPRKLDCHNHLLGSPLNNSLWWTLE